MTDAQAVTPAEVWDRLRADDPLRILDIRDRPAVDQWRLDGDAVAFTHVPRAKLLQAKATETLDDVVADIEGEGPITVVCAEGRASDEIAAFLREAGHDARNLTEGMEGWARLYESVELDADPTVLQYQRPSSGCLSYMIVDGDAALVLDPLAAFVDRYVADAEERGATVRFAVDTHVHADHVSGVRELADATGATAVVPERALERGLGFEAATVGDGDTLDVGGTAVEAVYAPGHTTDMTAFVVGDVLLAGDSLFVESVARPDLEVDDDGVEALARDLYATLHDRFGAFEDGTLVAPAHHGEGVAPGEDGSYTATLGTLRETLALYGLSEAAFVDRITSGVGPRPANDAEIIAINLGHRTVDRETALELELGPNNCAAG